MKERRKNILEEVAAWIFVLLLIFAAVALVSSCATARKAQNRTEDVRRDSVRTELRYIERTTIDTVFVTLPVETSSAQTLDSTSHLETSLAVSDARIENGVLSHTLTNKQSKLPVEVPKKELQKDSVIYRDKEIYIDKVEYKYIEREKTRYEKLCQWWFWISIAVILSWLVFHFRKQLLNFVRRFI